MTVSENISVYVRVRPLSDQEQGLGRAWRVEGSAISQVDPATGQQKGEGYTLDAVFAGEPTAAVYERTARPLIQQVLEGVNSTVLAYGQTSSGKTHTMRGSCSSTSDAGGGSGGELGIIPLAVSELFVLKEQTVEREFLLRVSYLEIYNEEVKDLLAPSSQRLAVHEGKEGGVQVAGLQEEIVTSPEQVLALLEAGERSRHMGETRMNKHSSRSHTVFRMVVESRRHEEEGDLSGAVRVSVLTLVDLAGSERASKTGAEGARLKEGANINKSLLTLGTVISKLSEGVADQGGHIPFRDSKLTRILQPSLGGNARTAIICAVTPAPEHAEETHSTLRFACRAKRVVNRAAVNEVLTDAAVLKRQAKEVEELRRQMAAQGSPEVEAEIARLRAELLRREQEGERMQAELAAALEERGRAEEEQKRADLKVESLTRMMLEGSRQVSIVGSKAQKDRRRETYCPGTAGHVRSPLRPVNHGVAAGQQEGGKGGSPELEDDREGAGEGQQAACGDIFQHPVAMALLEEQRRLKASLLEQAGAMASLQGEAEAAAAGQLAARQRAEAAELAVTAGEEKLATARQLLEGVQQKAAAAAAARNALIAELTHRAEVAEAAAQEAQQAATALASERAQLQCQLEAAAQQAQQAQQAADEAQQREEELQQQVASLQGRLGEMQSTITTLNVQLAEDSQYAAQELGRSRQRADAAEAAQRAAEQEAAGLAARVAELEARLAASLLAAAGGSAGAERTAAGAGCTEQAEQAARLVVGAGARQVVAVAAQPSGITREELGAKAEGSSGGEQGWSDFAGAELDDAAEAFAADCQQPGLAPPPGPGCASPQRPLYGCALPAHMAGGYASPQRRAAASSAAAERLVGPATLQLCAGRENALPVPEAAPLIDLMGDSDGEGDVRPQGGGPAAAVQQQQPAGVAAGQGLGGALGSGSSTGQAPSSGVAALLARGRAKTLDLKVQRRLRAVSEGDVTATDGRWTGN